MRGAVVVRVRAEDASAHRSVRGDTAAIMRMVEVLPAPLGPRKPKASPARHVEVDLVDGGEVAEALRQAAGADKRRAGGVRIGHSPDGSAVLRQGLSG